MITEDYVSFETAKLLNEKGFEVNCYTHYSSNGKNVYYNYQTPSDGINMPTLQMATKWVQETFNVVIIPNYEYECDDTPWCYKIYQLGENGKPKRVPVEGVSYDMNGEPHVEVVAYRDYQRSFADYATKEEAIEEGIKYCLEKFI